MDGTQQPLLEVRNLKKHFPLRSKGLMRRTVGVIRAVDDVSFSMQRGETLGVIGESGCGKTTLGRCISWLYEADDGEIVLREGEREFRPGQIEREDNSEFRKLVQVIFQDPFSSLNPRMSVLRSVGEPLRVNGIASGRDLEERVVAILQRVGLEVGHLQRFPHSFSGGQRQRICIARALVINPQLVVADEPVSALDVSIQAQTLNLLKDLQQEFGLSYLFISHSMSVIRYMSDRILVMYAGKIVESGSRDVLLGRPLHPYTEMLLKAVPRVSRRQGARLQEATVGEPPDLLNLPGGCVFHPRCPHARDLCREEIPTLRPLADGRQVSCHLAEELTLAGVFD
ncbi:MAG: ATP-binding cassette domain-containing protein [Anaerolineaceae bacterium]|nr:ATP-binding cassette domain-containing protein [Anaerolineaceae bacterium]MCY4023658.1 ATP-binding cassette domain-containing protein [Anaerolineaceae bacterium]